MNENSALQKQKSQLIFCSFHALDSTCLAMQWSLFGVRLKYMGRTFYFSYAMRFLCSHKALKEKHISITCKGLSKLVHEKYLKLRNLALFYEWKMQESGLTEIIPFMCISAPWGQHPAFFYILGSSK